MRSFSAFCAASSSPEFVPENGAEPSRLPALSGVAPQRHSLTNFSTRASMLASMDFLQASS